MAYRKKRMMKRKSAKRRSYKRSKRPAIKKLIRREIARAVETKSRQYGSVSHNIYSANDAGTLDASMIPLGPTAGYLQIDQGVGNGARVGDRIKTKRLTFKGTITPAVYNAVTNNIPMPMAIKLWIFYDKTDPTNNPIPATNGDFFQFNNTNQGFANDLVDLWKPVNAERYRVLTTRIYKLGNSISAGSGAQPTYQNFANNDFKYNVNFNINCTPYYPKNVKFDNTFADPTSRGLFALFQVCYANGNPVGAGQVLANMSYMLDYKYEDA